MRNKILIFGLLLIGLAALSGCRGEGASPKIEKETFEPFSMESTLPAEGTLQVPVTNLTSPKKKDVLVSSGIPFAPGQLFSEENFAVFDRTGKEISIAVKALAKWTYDDSIRSLLVQFPLEIEHKYKPVFIQWGKPRTKRPLKLTEVSWVLPEGHIILPKKWLCLSRVIGEQVPFGEHAFTKYEKNIERHYPRLRDFFWTGNVAKDSYYDTPHVFYQLYVRSGDEEYFKSARREAVRYRDDLIVQRGANRGGSKASKKLRYIYLQAMADDYLLTGDSRSLLVVGYMAEYLKNNFNPDKAFFPKKGKHFWTERLAAFPLLGAVTYYELTGKKEYLEFAREIMHNLYKTQNEWPDRGGFIHNLYSHDPEEGARKNEYGGSPFMTGLLLEAVVKYHSLTGSNMAKDSILRALDWVMKEGLSPDGTGLVYLTCDKHRYGKHPDLNLAIVHAFGYGYKISGYKRKDYLEVGKNIFEEGMNKAYLRDRKHFNQNYRSSGHFLAYIEE
jgi:hypothetical protein